MPLRTDLPGFATALSRRLPGGNWRTQEQTFATFEEQWPVAGLLWDAGPARSALLDHPLESGAVLHGPGGTQLSVTVRPSRPRQFLVAALKPEGVQRHNFSVVDDPMGISVPDDPVRAACAVARRLLPRYLRALKAVRRDARARPEPPHRPAAPAVARSVTLIWHPDGVVGAPYDSVPADARAVLYGCRFTYDLDQYAFVLPASASDAERALLLQSVIRLLTAQGIGVDFRHATPHIPAPPSRPHPTGPGVPLRPAQPPPTVRR
ncbi:hypothetical protein [Streptomyces sp. SP18BB07]|uniref:hypothetical protein n=1 Tax=Streptomyces sp. SP18BB07 TaxID=3002522 RepID=UPI002E796C68|nr:hypothetical protein [Streptomyces sp. SP18BB07]MEE1765297.1 hypothetical protein [Streptomyces sp. SP18BB07]